MDANKLKTKRRLRRRLRIRKRIRGSEERPRMSVYRSHQNIYVQLIDDDSGKTLCEANTRNLQLRDSISYGGNVKAAAVIGKEIAQRAQAKGIQRVVFDRSGFRYHGRVDALASAAREAGLKF